jgi:hypothetical protein
VRVRLTGQALFHERIINWAGKGPQPPAPPIIYLDGAAFGEGGTPRRDGAARIDLRLPSGSGAVASDLESWFYLAPTQTVTSVSVNPNSLTAVVGASGAFEGVSATGTSNLVTPMATVALLYPALADASVSLTLTADIAGADAIATVPATVTVPRGAEYAEVALTISAAANFTVAGPTVFFEPTGGGIRPPVNPVAHADPVAPVNPAPGPAKAEQAAQPTAPAQPAEPAKPAEQAAPKAIAPDPPASPTLPLPLPGLHPPGNSAQPEPVADAEPPAASEPPAAPDSPSPPDRPPATA